MEQLTGIYSRDVSKMAMITSSTDIRMATPNEPMRADDTGCGATQPQAVGPSNLVHSLQELCDAQVPPARQ